MVRTMTSHDNGNESPPEPTGTSGSIGGGMVMGINAGNGPNGTSTGNGLERVAIAEGYGDWQKTCDDMLGEEITLRCKASHSGQTEFIQIHVGEEVVKAKSLLATAFGVEYGQITLFVGDKMMMDPLSISDIPEINSFGMTDIRAEINA